MSNDTKPTNKGAITTTPDSVIDKVTPDSLAEATTKPLADDALGGHATQDQVEK